MIVLSRQVGQSIVIGQPPNQRTVTVVELSGAKVRLAVNSPDGSDSPRRSLVEGGIDVIRLSPDITVNIVDIRGDKVRLGVEAPMNCSVHRVEIFEAIQ